MSRCRGWKRGRTYDTTSSSDSGEDVDIMALDDESRDLYEVRRSYARLFNSASPTGSLWAASCGVFKFKQ